MADRSDDFNRSDSTTSLGTPSDGGSGWIVPASTWGIESNRGYCVGADGFQNIAVLESSESDVEVQATLAVYGANSGLIVRCTDDNNYFVFVFDVGFISLYRKQAGGFTSLGAVAITETSGDVFKVVADGDGLACFQNGVQRLPSSGTTTDSFNQTATLHGLRKFGTGATRFDDFSITALGGGGATFQAAWAAGANVLLGGNPA